MRFIFYCCLLFAAFYLLSCGNHDQHRHAFYYWKTTYNTDTATVRRVANSGADKFYIRYLDVDWSETHHMPVPLGELQVEYRDCPFIVSNYVPVVFITNRTFEQMSPEWTDSLAFKLTRRVERITNSLEATFIDRHLYDIPGYNDNYYTTARPPLDTMIGKLRERVTTEIQIDCDWAASTREKYFRFLRRFKELNKGKTISVTLRLYPYKYLDKVGVPPVDRAMLMCYNLGKIKDSNTRNSILDITEMKQYFSAKAYPLPLDIALPVFGWFAWFRQGQYKGIVHEHQNFVADTTLFKKHKDNSYAITVDTVIADNYYRQGDEFRYEQPSDADVQAAADIAAKHVPGYGTISFFDWNDYSIVTYEKAIQVVFARH